jgi:hypothetical protein
MSLGAGAFAMILNQDFWNAMSPEDQKIFMELWNKAYDKLFSKNQSKRRINGKEELYTVSNVPARSGIHGGSDVKKCPPVSEPHGVRTRRPQGKLPTI